MIELQRIKDALPNRAEVTITKYNGSQEGKGSSRTSSPRQDRTAVAEARAQEDEAVAVRANAA